jgi:hypothetical protein
LVPTQGIRERKRERKAKEVREIRQNEDRGEKQDLGGVGATGKIRSVGGSKRNGVARSEKRTQGKEKGEAKKTSPGVLMNGWKGYLFSGFAT